MVVGAPQIISQPFSSFFFFFVCVCPAALWDLANSKPVISLMLSYHLFFCLPCLFPPFTVPCELGSARPDKQETCSYHFSLRLFTGGQDVFVWSNCLLDLGTNFLFASIVFVWDALYLAVANSFHGFCSSLQLCCEGPWFTSVQENGCDKGVHQSHLGTERNTLVNPNWFQTCQYRCSLCYPGRYFRLGTLVKYNWTQVLEACDCLKLL